MTQRATNYLRDLDQAAAAISAGATCLRLCPASDEAASEVSAGILDAGYQPEQINGFLFARLAPGDVVACAFTPAPPAPQRWVTYTTLQSIIGWIPAATLEAWIKDKAVNGLGLVPAVAFARLDKQLDTDGINARDPQVAASLALFVQAGALTSEQANKITA